MDVLLEVVAQRYVHERRRRRRSVPCRWSGRPARRRCRRRPGRGTGPGRSRRRWRPSVAGSDCRVDPRTGHHQEPQVRQPLPNQGDRVQHPAEQVPAGRRAADGHHSQPLVRPAPPAGPYRRSVRHRRRVETGDVAGEVEVLPNPAIRSTAGRARTRPEPRRPGFRRRSTGPAAAPNRARCSSISAFRSAVSSRSRSSASGIGSQPTKSVSQANANRFSSGFSCSRWSTSQASSATTRSKCSDSHHVGEHREVVDQRLVHPADRLEGVQIVLAAVALELGVLAEQSSGGGMDPLLPVGQHPGDRMLGQPVDLDIRPQPLQCLGDRHIAPGVAQADRGGQHQHPAGPARSRVPRSTSGAPDQRIDRPGRSRRSRPVAAQTDSRISRLISTGCRAGRQWLPPSTVISEPPVSSASRWPTAIGRIRSSVPWMTVTGHRTCRQACLQRRAQRAVQAEPAGGGVRQHRRVGGRRPLQQVLQLLGRVRLGAHLLEEEPAERVEVAVQPDMPVVHRPAGSRRTRAAAARRRSVRPGRGAGPGIRRTGRSRRSPATRSGCVGGGVHRPGDRAGQRHQHGAVGAGRVQHGEDVLRADQVGVGGGAGRHRGPAGAPAVVGDDPELPGQRTDLELSRTASR